MGVRRGSSCARGADLGERPDNAAWCRVRLLFSPAVNFGGVGGVDQGRIYVDVFGMGCGAVGKSEGDGVSRCDLDAGETGVRRAWACGGFEDWRSLIPCARLCR